MSDFTYDEFVTRNLGFVTPEEQAKLRAARVFIPGVGDDAGFDESRSVITNAYTGGSDGLKKSFDETAKHRQQKYNDLCTRLLDYARGDDILQVGQVNMAAAQKYAFTEVPRDSLPGLVLSGGFLGLQSIFLPLIHWLDAKRPWGSLRPWRSARS